MLLETDIKIILKNKLVNIRQVFHRVLNFCLEFLQLVSTLLLVGLGVEIFQDGNLTIKEVQLAHILVIVRQTLLIDLSDLFISFRDLLVLFLHGRL